MAFRLSDFALSRMATASACCCAAGRPGLLGQSIFATVDTHAARNSRGAAGASVSGTGGTDGGADPVGAGGRLVTGACGGVVVQLLSNPPRAREPAASAIAR